MHGLRGIAAAYVFCLLAVIASYAQARGNQQPAIGRGLAKRSTRQLSRVHRPHVKARASARSMAYSAGSGSAPTNAGFFAAPQIASGGSATMPVQGDFNGDSKVDVAVLVYDIDGNPSISVLLGNGDGTFQAPRLFAAFSQNADTSVENLFVADLNGDGKADLIVFHSGSFDVLTSNGDGTFNDPLNYSDAISNPTIVGFNDVNGDGIPDVMVADSSSNAVSTLLGNGDATFQSPTQVTHSGSVTFGVFEDVNGDGRPDLITTSSVFLATAGGFQPPITLTNDQGQVASCNWIQSNVAVADVNHDGKRDIITADCQSNTVSVFLNTGTGFATGVSHWTGPYPAGVIVADVNRDGNPDIIAINDYENGLSVLIGAGDGSFQDAHQGYSFGTLFWYAPVVADFNGDRVPDLITAQYSPGFVTPLSYLQGVGDGTFLAALDQFWQQSNDNSYAGAYANGMATSDFNHDGRPDFVVGNYGDAHLGVLVFLTNSGAAIAPPTNYGSGGGLWFVATADFDGDGNSDIAASDSFTGNVELFLGKGDGTFQSAQAFPALSGTAYGIVAGDFNQDGKPDIAVAGSSSVAVLLNDGSKGFLAPVAYPLNSLGWEMVSVDLNGDGKLDLAITQSQSHYISILLGNGDGSFQSLPDADITSYGPLGIASGDFNGDGKFDLAVTAADWTGGAVGTIVMLGKGDGTFQPRSLYASSDQGRSWPAEIQATDINKDGKIDLIYADAGLGEIGILFGQGNGTFYNAVYYPSNADPYGLALADVNGDGALDAIAGCESFPGITMSLNISGTKTSLTSSVNPAESGEPMNFTALVLASVSGVKGVPTGTVTLLDGTSVIGSASLNAGQASFTVSDMAVGTHTVSVSYSGDASFQGSTSPTVTQSITLAASQVSLVSSVNPAAFGQALTLTATVTPELSSIKLLPSGTVTFTDAGVSLGTVALNSGVASLALSKLAIGTHSISAAYSGDSNFQASASSLLTQTITSTAGGDFRLTSNLSSLSVPAGQSGSVTLTVTPLSGFSGKVDLACQQVPAGITCQTSPPAVTIQNGQTKSSSLRVSVASSLLARRISGPSRSNRAVLWSLASFVLGFIGISGVGGRKGRVRSAVLAILLLASMLGMVACGAVEKQPTSPAPTTEVIQVSATFSGQNGAQIVHTLNLNLTIQ